MTDHSMLHYMLENDSLRDALRLVEEYEPFHALPVDLPREGAVIGFLRRIGPNRRGLSRGEGLSLLRTDLLDHMASMRARIFTADADRLGAPRIAVLLHLAQVLGPSHMLDWTELWADLGRGDFQAAADHLLLSEWPAHYDTAHERIRAVALQRILRTGEMPRRAA